MDLLSIVVPCYNEKEALPYFYKEINKISKQMQDVKFELLFVNDGSKDNTIEIIKSLSEKDERVKYISFSRNFGKEAAMYAGLKMASGDYIAIMDADLQDPPKLLPGMYKMITTTDNDIIGLRRKNRAGEGKILDFFKKSFYHIIGKISKTEMVSGARDFRLMTRQVVDAILELQEYNRYSKGIFSWVGFQTYWLEYENVERVAGKTKWSFWKLFVYAMEGIVAFSTAPLVFASLLGIVFLFLAFLLIVFIIIRTAIYGDPTSGWPSLVCILFFVSGIQLFCLGIIGQYLSKTYLETKKRPIYIIKETNKDVVKKDVKKTVKKNK
ncbi:MAG: glycosyltransferase family 2 protein [Bacilli bacterium]|nr:glycosyltransferase family 2 protein [Bacilli bacterium]